MTQKLPEWALVVLDSWPRVRHRFEKRWLELATDVWPSLERQGFKQSAPLGHGPTPYQSCLDTAAWCAEFAGRESLQRTKSDRDSLIKLNRQIRATAERLAEYLLERDQLLESGNVTELDGTLDLWTLLRRAAEQQCFDWYYVANSPPINLWNTIDMALGQSRSPPELVNVVEEIAHEAESEIAFSRAYSALDGTRQISAARLHVLDSRLKSKGVLEHLTDDAFSVLAAVAFDVSSEKVTPQSIAMLRSRKKKRNSEAP